MFNITNQLLTHQSFFMPICKVDKWTWLRIHQGGEGEKFGKFWDNKYWKQHVSSNEKYPLIVASITTLYLNLGYPT